MFNRGAAISYFNSSQHKPSVFRWANVLVSDWKLGLPCSDSSAIALMADWRTFKSWLVSKSRRNLKMCDLRRYSRTFSVSRWVCMFTSVNSIYHVSPGSQWHEGPIDNTYRLEPRPKGMQQYQNPGDSGVNRLFLGESMCLWRDRGKRLTVFW